MNTSNTLYTIGHSNHDMAAFLALLTQHGVTALADVRAQPYSRRFPQFSRDALRDSLKAAGIAYVFLGRELGGRPDTPSLVSEGVADYSQMARTPLFQQGIERLVEGVGRHRIALMCAEREPLDCHRALLVAPSLKAAGLEVAHILADGGLEFHAQAEQRLRELVGLPELDFFRDAAATLEDAYRIQARRVAFKPEADPGEEVGP